MADITPTSQENKQPERPKMPEPRIMFETPLGCLWFDSQAELDAWRAEPFWRRMMGLTAYDRKIGTHRD